ncbi:heterokaryon incompatibility protein-domain-containing protein [Podospora conica]|nr:heterokaryon incompatibility protein-domain-containing protein [Schizothecium conicum]
MAFRHLDPEPWDGTPQDRPFEYEPLRHPRYIRLLKVNNFDLLTSEDWPAEEPPHFPCYEMVQAPLDDPPTYTALSYTWGRPERTHIVKISGAPLTITDSLAEALRELPRIAPSEYLWLDQICINQADDTEKNHQVQIMGEIYSDCQRVIIWTGGEIQGLQLAVDTYSSLSRRMADASLSDSPSEFPFDEETPFHDRYPVDVEPVWRLLQRPWFERAWVVQEAVLPNTAVVLAGSCQLAIEDLRWTTSLGYLYSDPKLNALGLGVYTQVQFSRSLLETIFVLRHPSAPQHPFGPQDHGFDSLVMDSLASNKASDPRDHVYAFLGFQKDANISIVPDYGLSITEVFARAARAVIEGTNSLELLRFLPNSHCNSQLAEEDIAKLPSWVPDWSGRRTSGRILRNQSPWLHWQTSNFDAAKGMPHGPNPSALGHDSELVVSGQVIDTIAAIMSSADEVGLEDDLPRFFTLTDEEVTTLDPTAFSDAEQKLRKRMVVTLAGGCIGSPVKPPPPAFDLSAEDVLKRYDEGEPLGDSVDLEDPLFRFTERVRELVLYTSARTEKNKLALVPDDACVGDLVAILHGFQVPMVLRPREGVAYALHGFQVPMALRPREGGTYAVVGPCYREDAMLGEAVTWKEDEADKFTLV